MEKEIPEYVRIPRAELGRLERFLIEAIRRLAAVPGVETQQLSKDGEVILLDLAGSWARVDTLEELWGASGRPALPPAAQRPRIPGEEAGGG